MGVFSFFKNTYNAIKMTRLRELGGYTATFTRFGDDIYRSDVVRSCIRTLSDFSSKAKPTCTDQNVLKVLHRPNQYMTGSKFVAKVRTLLEINNSAFIYLIRDDRGKLTGLYPVPYSKFEALEYNGGVFVKFYFSSDECREMVCPLADLAILRKDYNRSDISGDTNDAILDALEMLNTTRQGMNNAIHSTSNLRGILKSTKGMLKPEDIKRQKDEFVKDYLSLENSGGIASLDATQEFTPIKMEPVIANSDQMKIMDANIYRYFGIAEKFIVGDFTESEYESLYSLRIEPFLIELSEELTNKIFSDREIAFGNCVIYESNRLQFASMKTKISVYKEVVLYGGMLINEWREGCNMAPVPWGDEMMMRLDAGFSEKEGEDDD